MEEIWKDVKGFEGKYKISNYGRVLSLNYRNTDKKQLLRLSKTVDGYVKVRLQYKGKDISERVHRVVAEAFIPNPNNKETVNHIDGNKENNRVDNLEWADRSEQLYHAYSKGLRKTKKGTSNCNSTLTEQQIREIRRLYKPRDKVYNTIKLGEIYGVNNATIGDIVRGVTYTDIK